jgi:Uma2 family endonuclease
MSAVLTKETLAQDHSAPTIAIEVVSPDDLAEAVMDKVLYYLENGSRLVWLISPQTKTATIYRPDNTGKFLRANDTLDGEDVLPNFKVKLSDFFEV